MRVQAAQEEADAAKAAREASPSPAVTDPNVIPGDGTSSIGPRGLIGRMRGRRAATPEPFEGEAERVRAGIERQRRLQDQIDAEQEAVAEEDETPLDQDALEVEDMIRLSKQARGELPMSRALPSPATMPAEAPAPSLGRLTPEEAAELTPEKLLQEQIADRLKRITQAKTEAQEELKRRIEDARRANDPSGETAESVRRGTQAGEADVARAEAKARREARRAEIAAERERKAAERARKAALTPEQKKAEDRERMAKVQAARPVKLLTILKKRGGLSKESARNHGLDVDAMQESVPGIFTDSKGRKGTLDWTEAANWLISEGHAIAPREQINTDESKVVLTDWLLQKLEAKATTADSISEERLAREATQEKAKEERDRLAQEEAERVAQLKRSQQQNRTRLNERGILVSESGEELFSAAGTASPQTASRSASPSPASPAIGPFEIIQTIHALFRVPYYVTKITKKARALFAVRPEAVKVGPMHAGNAPVFMHEAAHAIDKRDSIITGQVPAGLALMDYDPQRLDQSIAAKEGFAEYLRMRVTGQLDAFVAQLGPQEAQAVKDAVAWVDGKLSAQTKTKLDRVAGLFQRFAQQAPIQQMQGLISPTGQMAQPELTRGEQAKQAASETLDAFLTATENYAIPLQRMVEEAMRRGRRFAVRPDVLLRRPARHEPGVDGAHV